MKHKFLPKHTDKSLCALCSRISQAHDTDAICESCSNQADCELVGTILMCPACQLRDKELRDAKGTNLTIAKPIAKVLVRDEMSPTEKVVNQVNRLLETNQIANDRGEAAKDIINNAIQGNIKEFTDFFNAKIPSIVELEQTINADDTILDKKYYLAKLLGERVKYLGKVLFQFNHKTVEISGELKAVQKYMNDIIPSIRKELRSEFAASNVDYRPQVIKEPKAPSIRMNPTEKLAQNYAKMMNIPIERARILVGKGLKESGMECSCAVTPGICTIHHS